MNEKPILFKGDMVKAVLAGTKTQTRRVVKNACDLIQDWDKNDPTYGPFFEDKYGDSHETVEVCPYGAPGDRLWVKQTFWAWGHWEKRGKTKMGKERWRFIDQTNLAHPTVMDVDGKPTQWAPDRVHLGYHKRPSIFMRREYSRIDLLIKSVRVERVQDITWQDVIAEGAARAVDEQQTDSERKAYCINQFESLWDSINGKPRKDGTDISWAANPYVWIVEFARLEGE